MITNTKPYPIISFNHFSYHMPNYNLYSSLFSRFKKFDLFALLNK